jgi:hypothetical protein
MAARNKPSGTYHGARVLSVSNIQHMLNEFPQLTMMDNTQQNT